MLKTSAQRKLCDQELYNELQPVYYDNFIGEQHRRNRHIQNLIQGA